MDENLDTADRPNLLNETANLDEEDELLDAEELSHKKKLVENIKHTHENSSPLSHALAGSLSQESLNQDESRDLQQKDILNKFSESEKNKTQTEDKKRNLKSSNSKYSNSDIITEFVNIKSIKSNKSNKVMYPISAEKFAQFESMLFDLVGFTTSSYKVEDEQATKAPRLDKIDITNSKFVPNMEVLSHKLEINSANHVQVKKVNARNGLDSANSDTDNASLDEERTQNLYFKAKLVTIMLNEPLRPRRACRVLLTKRNTNSLDSIINEIENIFKVDSIKKIFNLSGLMINNPIDMYYQDDIFIAVTNEKINNKDFDLDPEEIKVLYINEFMKGYSKLDPTSIIQRNAQKADFNRKKSHQTENLMINSQNQIEFMPEELLENYEIGRVIGEGNYSIVRECKDINTGIQFALKIIDLKKNPGREEVVDNEINILRRVKHPNIVKLVEDYNFNNYVYLVFEYYKAGDLLETITKRKKFLEKDAAAIIYTMASTIDYLHSLCIIHRDIKLDNIMVQVYPDGSKSLKLGDFGSAVYAQEGLSEKCGSPVYVAPEILSDKSYGLEVDVWSLGIVAYILLCGYAPFEGQSDEETFDLIKNQELKFLEEDWLNISGPAIDLIRKMLDRNPENRVKASEILNHHWFNRDDSSQEREKSEITKSGEHLQTSRKSEISIGKFEETLAKSKPNTPKLVLTQIKKRNNYKTTNVQ
ncbi:serine threonine- kinase DCLK2 isoform X3, partial [Brachionus plicatilis]